MSIYGSWPEVGIHEDGPEWGEPDRTVLAYLGSHVYPDPIGHPPATVGISHIPGFIWRPGMPDDRREQLDDDPVAPFLRLDIAQWKGKALTNIGDAVLTRKAVETLRDQLTEWLERPTHRE